MIYSDADLKGAVEAARQIFHKAAEDVMGFMSVNELLDLTPEEFYQKVLEFARSKQ